MKKSEIFEKKMTLDVVVAGLKAPQGYVLEASEQELISLAKRFDVEKIHYLKVNLTVYPNDIVRVAGKIKALTRRQCVLSLESFDEKMTEDFEVLYAESDKLPSDTDEIIDVIDKGRIHLGDVVAEQYGLALNPFPKKPGVKNVFEDTGDETQKPFANLKQMMKK
ncbi:MAG: DUF177 domain-containing protein [Alphaproteobacteria bacterium]|nr:DUF177 domain-containing protein [Alphaproteobacteria bacterium]